MRKVRMSESVERLIREVLESDDCKLILSGTNLEILITLKRSELEKVSDLKGFLGARLDEVRTDAVGTYFDITKIEPWRSR